MAKAGYLVSVGKSLLWKRYRDENRRADINSTWFDLKPSGFGGEKIYIVETNIEVVERVILMATDPGDLVFDPTCGSGTTAIVAEQWGRRWITYRYVTRRASIGTIPYYGCTLSVLLAGRLSRRPAQGI